MPASDDYVSHPGDTAEKLQHLRHPEADIERRIAPFWVKKHNNGYAGRQLYRSSNSMAWSR